MCDYFIWKHTHKNSSQKWCKLRDRSCRKHRGRFYIHIHTHTRTHAHAPTWWATSKTFHNMQSIVGKCQCALQWRVPENPKGLGTLEQTEGSSARPDFTTHVAEVAEQTAVLPKSNQNSNLTNMDIWLTLSEWNLCEAKLCNKSRLKK